MPKSKHKALIDSLKARFPHLAGEISASARGIYDAQRISEACASGLMKFEKGKASIKALAKTGALPSQVAKWFLENLDPPPVRPRYKPMGRMIPILSEDLAKIAKAKGDLTPLEIFERDYAAYRAARDAIISPDDFNRLTIDKKQHLNAEMYDVLSNFTRYENDPVLGPKLAAMRKAIAERGQEIPFAIEFLDFLKRRAGPIPEEIAPKKAEARRAIREIKLEKGRVPRRPQRRAQEQAPAPPIPPPPMLPPGQPGLPGELYVIVKDRAGVPVPRAVVRISGPVSRALPLGEDGACFFPNLPYGTYSLRITYPSATAVMDVVSIPSGERVTKYYTLDIELPRPGIPIELGPAPKTVESQLPSVQGAKAVKTGKEFTKKGYALFNPFGAALRAGRAKLAEEAKKHADRLKTEFEGYTARRIDIEKRIAETRRKIAEVEAAKEIAGELTGIADLAGLAGPQGMAASLALKKIGGVMKGMENEKIANLGTTLEFLAGRWSELVENVTDLERKFKDRVRDHLMNLVPGIAAEMADKFDIRDRQADIQAVLTKDAELEAARYEGYLATGKVGKKAFQYGGMAGMPAADIFRTIMVDYWGVWAGLIAFLFAGLPGVTITLVIFGATKRPALLTPLVILFQFAFLTGVSILVPPLPGYTGISVPLAIMWGAVGAIANLVINIKKPPRGFQANVAHFLAGAVIGLGATMLVLALQAFGANPASLLFIVITIFLVGLAAFQVYPSGGLGGINMLAMVVLVFAYFALGPYSGYVVGVTDQIAAPIKAISAGAQTAVSDIWLLITNPTQYSAQQQLRQFRPERPISFPKALEITRLDVIPSIVPANEQFVLFAAFENQGDQDAREVRVSAACAESAPRDVGTCSPVSGGDYDGKRTFRPGQADRAEWSFKASGRTGREPGQRVAETVFNTVNVTLSAVYDTSSSLQVEVATPEEITRRQTQPGGRFYYTEPAVGKVSPAQISITVGPQPLIEGREATAIVAITNSRPDGNVIFRSMELAETSGKTRDDASKVTIRLSPIIGSDLNCKSQFLNCVSEAVSEQGGQIQAFICTSQQKSYRLERYELRSVVPIFCTFKVKEIPPEAGSVTGLITAELQNYRFDHLQSKKVQVTAPLGVLEVSPSPPPQSE